MERAQSDTNEYTVDTLIKIAKLKCVTIPEDLRENPTSVKIRQENEAMKAVDKINENIALPF